MSTDALGMALGVLFGVMAGIPAALLALSANETIRHEHVHRVELPQQPPAATLSSLPQNTQPQPQIAQSSVIVLPGKAQKRIEAHQ